MRVTMTISDVRPHPHAVPGAPVGDELMGVVMLAARRT